MSKCRSDREKQNNVVKFFSTEPVCYGFTSSKLSKVDAFSLQTFLEKSAFVINGKLEELCEKLDKLEGNN
jgi:hypothetical protein